MATDYQPVACALHSEYELLAMHRTAVTLTLTDGSQLKGRVIDLQTRDGAEFLALETSSQQVSSVRLDLISECSSLPAG